MAWIESHQSLGTHLKLRRLARELRIHRAQAIGHLHFLWWWALDNAPTGNLSALAPAEIAEVAEWPGSGDQFIAAMKSCGWIDENGMIHDWMEYAGFLIQQREKDKKRKRDARNKGLQQSSDGSPEPVQRTSSGHPADIQRTSSGRRTDGGRTQPNPTQPIEDPPPAGEPGPPLGLPVELPPGFPPNEAAAKFSAIAIGCTEAFAVDEWHRAVSRGGRDHRDVPIRSWASYLRTCWTSNQNRTAENANRDRNNGGGRHGQPSASDIRRSLVAGADDIHRDSLAIAAKERELAESGRLPI